MALFAPRGTACTRGVGHAVPGGVPGVGGGVPGVVHGWVGLGGLYRYPTSTLPGHPYLVIFRLKALPTAK